MTKPDQKYTYEQALMFAYKRSACQDSRDVLQNFNSWSALRAHLPLNQLVRYAQWFSNEIEWITWRGDQPDHAIVARLRLYIDQVHAINDAARKDELTHKSATKAAIGELVDKVLTLEGFQTLAMSKYERMLEHRRHIQESLAISIAALQAAFIDDFYLLVCSEEPHQGDTLADLKAKDAQGDDALLAALKTD